MDDKLPVYRTPADPLQRERIERIERVCIFHNSLCLTREWHGTDD